MKRIFYILLLILISSIYCQGQDWIVSKQLTCDNDLRLYDIKKDENNNVYLAGKFKGTFNGNVSKGNYDLCLVKLNELLNIEWVRVMGSASAEKDPRIVIDNDNNIFFTGAFQDSCIFDTEYLKSEGDYDIFLAKYSNSGNLLWAKNIAKYASQQNPTDIDVDGDNNLIITGHYTDSTYIYDEKIVQSGKNNFYSKFDTSGVKIWVKNVSGTSTSSRLANIKVYQDEYYFNGYFRDEINFDLETVNSNVAGKQDLFLFKTDKDGNGIWLRRTYGDNLDVTGSIAGDNYGNVYFTGYFQSSNLNADYNADEISSTTLTNVNDFDIFVFKYNKAGVLQLSKQFGGIGREYGTDLNVNNDILYMSGYFSDAIGFGDQTLTSSGTADRDMFLASFDLNANAYNSISLGGTDANDIAAGAIVLNSGDAIMAGYFQSSSIVVGSSTYTNTSPGLRDGVVAKYSAPLSAVFSEINEISCNGDVNGKLVATAEFGQKPYTYEWSHDVGLTDSVANNLNAGVYNITVTDAVNSTKIISYTLIEPAPINFNPSITNITACSYSLEGAIDLNMSGGNGGFEYQWQATNGGFGAVFNVEDQSGLTIGTYNVSVTDVNQCIADTSIILTGPDPVVFTNSIVTDSSSLGLGAIDLQYSGGFGVSFTFDWEYPSGATATTEDISNLNTGNYNVTVTDAHACEFDTIFNVANLDAFYIFIEEYKDACKGTINGTATASYYSPTSHTGINYLWDGNAGSQTTAQATNLAPGRYYYVTVTDVENDPDIVLVDSVYIDELTYDFTGSLSGTSLLNCFGDVDGYVDLTITSGAALPYTYNWSTGSNLQDLTDVSVGSYSVTVTDDNSCQFSEVNFAINQPTALAVAAEIVNEPSCNGDFDGEITVDRSGGTIPYSYQWDDPGFQNTRSADGLDAGFYTVTVTDNNSCSASSGINLTEPDEISVLKVVSDESCNTSSDGFASLTVSGGTSPFSYFWSTTNGTGLNITDKDQSGLTAGDYYFTITDNNNCTFEDSVKIQEPVLLEITLEETTNGTSCTGVDNGSINITAAGGTGVLTYTLNPGAIQTNATGSFINVGSGTYTVDVEDENTCIVSSNPLVITEPEILTINNDLITNAYCFGTDNGSIQISIVGGTGSYAYVWTTSDGSGLIDSVEDQMAVGIGTYNLTVTDDNLCEANTSFSITEPESMDIEKSIFQPFCNGTKDGVIVLSVTGGTLPLSYFWSTIDGSGLIPTNKHQSELSPAWYFIRVDDANGCIYNDSAEIINPPVISILSESSTDASDNNANDGTITIEATGGTPPLTFTLNPGGKVSSSGIFDDLFPGEYIVEVSDFNVCGPYNSTSLTVGSTNSIYNINIDDKINIYPNPVRTVLNIDFNLELQDVYTLQLISISGQIVYTKEVNSGQSKEEIIEISSYPKGLYFIKIYNSKTSYQEKLILQ